MAQYNQYCGVWLKLPSTVFEPMTCLSDIAKQLGKRGGDTTKQKHGSEYYRRIGKVALAKRWKKATCPFCAFEGFTAVVEEHQKIAHSSAE